MMRLISIYRPFALAILFLGPTISALGQITYVGEVRDHMTGEPLPGVSVFVQGTTIGTATDSTGSFRFVLPAPPPSLSFSCVGYRTVTFSSEAIEETMLVELERGHIDLAPLVVTASRELESRTQVPASISSLSVSQIEHAKPSMLFQALNQVAGLHMVDLGNEQYKMSIRQPFTNKAYFLYMEDGVPLRPTGIFNPNALIDINMAGIDRVEVLRGPASAMYGSNAVAGALNFITPDPATLSPSSVSIRMDHHGYKRVDGSSFTGSDRLKLYVGGYAARQRNAWFDHSDFDKVAFTIRSDYHLAEGAVLETAATISRLSTDTNGALDSLNFFSRDISSLHTFTYRDMGASRVRSTLRKSWTDRQRSRITAFYRNATIEQLPYWRVRTKRSNRSEATGEINRDHFWSLGLLAQHEIFFDRLDSRLLFGASFDNSPASYRAEYIDVKKDDTGRYISYIAPDSLLSNYDVRIRNTAAYAQYEMQPLENFRVIASLRFDGIEYDYDNHLDPSAYSGAPDEKTAFNRISPKIGITYDLQRGRGVYANYSLGFAPPEINELYNGVKVPSLSPASFDSYEIGGWAAFLRGSMFFDVSLYTMAARDEIIPVILDDDSRENRNAGHTRHHGIEFTMLYQPIDALSFRLSGANALHKFIDYNENGFDYSGNRMMNAPAWIANGEIAVKPPALENLRFALEWQRVSSYELDNSNSATYGGYDIFNAVASYIHSSWQVWAKVNNLLDKTYATTAAAYSFGTLYNAGQVRTLTIGCGYTF